MLSKKSKTYRKIKKKVKPGQIYITPSDNLLFEEGEPPYVAGGKRMPSWFRGSPKSGVRRCSGISDFLSLGVVIPAWSTFVFNPIDYQNSDWQVQSAQYRMLNSQFSVDAFQYESTGKCPMTELREMKESFYPKLVTPYSFITAPGWSTIILGMVHEPNPHFDVVPGIVNTDYYHQINIVLNLKGSEKFSIRHNQPIAQLIPFKRSGDFSKILFGDESEFKYVYGKNGDQDMFDIRDGGDVARGYRRSSRDINN